MKILNTTEFEALKKFISENEIDPTFLNYGGFVSQIKPENYKKEYRQNILSFIGMYKIFTDSNLYTFDKENGNNLVLNESQKNEILPIIEERKKTPYFIDIFNSKFNCFGYEYTIYSDDFEKLLSFSNNWWLTQKLEKRFSIDSDLKIENEFKKECENEVLKRIEVLKSKGINILGYEVKKFYDLRNFTRLEFEFIKNEIVKNHKGINQQNHPTHQITRRTKKDIQHRIKDFKEYVLQPTKRRVLLDVHAYGLAYVEIDKLDNFNN